MMMPRCVSLALKAFRERHTNQQKILVYKTVLQLLLHKSPGLCDKMAQVPAEKVSSKKSLIIDPGLRGSLAHELVNLEEHFRQNSSGREFRGPIGLAINFILKDNLFDNGVSVLKQILVDMMTMSVNLFDNYKRKAKFIVEAASDNANTVGLTWERTRLTGLMSDILVAAHGMDTPSQLQEFCNLVNRGAGDQVLTEFIDSNHSLPMSSILSAINHCLVQAKDCVTTSDTDSGFDMDTCPRCSDMPMSGVCQPMDIVSSKATDTGHLDMTTCQGMINVAFRATVGILSANRNMDKVMKPLIRKCRIEGNPVVGVFGQKVDLGASGDLDDKVTSIMDHLWGDVADLETGLDEWFSYNKSYFCTAFQHLFNMAKVVHIIGQIQDNLREEPMKMKKD